MIRGAKKRHPLGFKQHRVGGFNPFEKYARQNGNLPQIGVKIKKCLKPPPRHPLKDAGSAPSMFIFRGVTVQTLKLKPSLISCGSSVYQRLRLLSAQKVSRCGV